MELWEAAQQVQFQVEQIGQGRIPRSISPLQWCIALPTFKPLTPSLPHNKLRNTSTALHTSINLETSWFSELALAAKSILRTKCIGSKHYKINKIFTNLEAFGRFGWIRRRRWWSSPARLPSTRSSSYLLLHLRLGRSPEACPPKSPRDLDHDPKDPRPFCQPVEPDLPAHAILCLYLTCIHKIKSFFGIKIIKTRATLTFTFNACTIDWLMPIDWFFRPRSITDNLYL